MNTQLEFDQMLVRGMKRRIARIEALRVIGMCDEITLTSLNLRLAKLEARLAQ